VAAIKQLNEQSDEQVECVPDEKVDVLVEENAVQNDDQIQSMCLDPTTYIKFMISNWAIANNVPLSQVSQLFKIQNSILSTLVRSELLKPELFREGLPTTARTVYKQLEIWKEDLFDEYACCVNHHLYPLKSFFDHNGELVRSMFCGETTFGKTASKPREVCAQPLLKETVSSTGKTVFRPVKLAPYRGITRCLRVLFQRKWFVDNLDHWKRLPDISPAMGDIYHGARWKRWIPWLQEHEFNLLLSLSIDW
jgi:hypothetical protein